MFEFKILSFQILDSLLSYGNLLLINNTLRRIMREMCHLLDLHELVGKITKLERDLGLPFANKRGVICSQLCTIFRFNLE